MAATIKDLSKKVGCSISTVSRALNGSYGVHPNTIEKVRQAAKELGYVPNSGAKQLVTQRSNLIGVFFPEFGMESIRDFEDFFAPLRKALRIYRKEMLIFSVPFAGYQEGSLREWVHSRSLEGCVFLQPFSKEHPLMKEALKLRIPCVNLGNSLGPCCSLVASDDYEGGRLAGTFLIRQGHRSIGYINGPEELSICQERYAGFRDALQSANVTHNPSWIEAGDFSGLSGAKSAALLLEKAPDLTAICCANDLMAMGAMLELYRRSISVPEHVSIMGYDGAFFTPYTTPPLSTVRHCFEWIGMHAAELLIELLNGGTGRAVRFPPELLVRESVKAVDERGL
ncbi:LacI family DNA-binding transcriptional regulator [Paenibacillus ihuae]|uniref:LacI family DNA-binding transcriptional regulator n=1 Tax=Paenibacillus ihuae TaxID=1232431 RepID=UPI0006D57940|nr:LacI family DNA-binding transcriptional regulator [Paenibacillus ihuae]